MALGQNILALLAGAAEGVGGAKQQGFQNQLAQQQLGMQQQGLGLSRERLAMQREEMNARLKAAGIDDAQRKTFLDASQAFLQKYAYYRSNPDALKSAHKDSEFMRNAAIAQKVGDALNLWDGGQDQYIAAGGNIFNTRSGGFVPPPTPPPGTSAGATDYRLAEWERKYKKDLYDMGFEGAALDSIVAADRARLFPGPGATAPIPQGMSAEDMAAVDALIQGSAGGDSTAQPQLLPPAPPNFPSSRAFRPDTAIPAPQPIFEGGPFGSRKFETDFNSMSLDDLLDLELKLQQAIQRAPFTDEETKSKRKELAQIRRLIMQRGPK